MCYRTASKGKMQRRGENFQENLRLQGIPEQGRKYPVLKYNGKAGIRLLRASGQIS